MQINAMMPCMSHRGFSFIELIITLAIVSILASVTMPLISVAVQRNKESELRHHLRQLREAIDAYKKASDEGRIKKEVDDTGYPPTLEALVEGVEDLKDLEKKKIKFLRRIPHDPMLTSITRSDAETTYQWGLRSYESSPDQPSAGAEVYDIYSLSTQLGTNGVPYARW
jgi:general secretion pathway protein G